MGVGSQRHTLAPFPAKQGQVFIVGKAGYTPWPVWTEFEEEKV
jgi:hypothetical protein